MTSRKLQAYYSANFGTPYCTMFIIMKSNKSQKISPFFKDYRFSRDTQLINHSMKKYTKEWWYSRYGIWFRNQLRRKNSKVFEQKGTLLNFKGNIDPMAVLSQLKPGWAELSWAKLSQAEPSWAKLSQARDESLKEVWSRYKQKERKNK